MPFERSFRESKPRKTTAIVPSQSESRGDSPSMENVGISGPEKEFLDPRKNGYRPRAARSRASSSPFSKVRSAGCLGAAPVLLES